MNCWIPEARKSASSGVFMRIIKIRKKVIPTTLNTRRIAKRMKSGYSIIKERGAKNPEGEEPKAQMQGGYMGMPFPLSQSLQISLQQRAEKEAAKGEKKLEYKGIPIPSGIGYFKGFKNVPEEREALQRVNMQYPLIKEGEKAGGVVFAYANIRWDEKMGALVYNVNEPRLTLQDRELLEKIKRSIEERLDVNFSKLGEIKAKELLKKEIMVSLEEIPQPEPGKIPVLQYFIEKEIIGLGLIEPLMKDPEIEDISCDGENIPIYVYHRNPKFGSIRTNIWFDNKADLDQFVLKLAQRCGKSVSIAEPLLDAALPDGSRVQCTMGTDIARRGSNFTIRKFTFYPLTPAHMLQYRTLNSMQMAYLWLAIESGKTILISGGTATGKTSLLNALSLFIKPDLKILSIEDTPELRLPHTHWVPEVARTPLSVKGKVGEVTLFDLLKSSLRQRPDYLVVGEVRGKEAFVLFQQIATGHPSLATIHAATLPQLVDRLITPPISLPPALIENVDIIVFLQRVKVKGKDVRRVNEIVEVIGVEKDRPVTVNIFEWDPASDDFIAASSSKVLESIARMSGLTEQSLQMEILRRKRILEWMHDNKTFDYREVSKIINSYYSDPERVMTFIEESAEG